MIKNSFNLLFDKPLTAYECQAVLRSEVIDIFISKYKYFHVDKNYELYKNYIRNKVQRNQSYITVLDLAINIEFWDIELFELAKKILLSSYTYLTKLSAFDYINIYYLNIPHEEYLAINRKVIGKSTNKLVLFQANINLLLNDKEYYLNKIVEYLRTSDLPTYFYRLSNNLGNFFQFNNLLNDSEIKLVSSLIKEKQFSLKVKNELIKAYHKL